jgi:hypothetical protein
MSRATMKVSNDWIRGEKKQLEFISDSLPENKCIDL